MMARLALPLVVIAATTVLCLTVILPMALSYLAAVLPALAKVVAS
jgi:hypothetical protein